jgi:hypothetical protein
MQPRGAPNVVRTAGKWYIDRVNVDNYTVVMRRTDPWRQRIKAIGLTQNDIASLLGWSRSGVYKALTQDPPSKPVWAVIVAAELMTGEQRARWIAMAQEIDREAGRE